MKINIKEDIFDIKKQIDKINDITEIKELYETALKKAQSYSIKALEQMQIIGMSLPLDRNKWTKGKHRFYERCLKIAEHPEELSMVIELAKKNNEIPTERQVLNTIKVNDR
jgi:hypothetical protein